MDIGAKGAKMSAGLGANPELTGLLGFRTSTYFCLVPEEKQTKVERKITESLTGKKIPLHGFMHEL